MALLPTAQTSFQRRLTRAFILPLLLMLVLASILFWLNHLLSVTQWVEHTDQVISQAHQTQKLLLDMETGIRGYALTGNAAFLKPYQESRLLIDSAFNDFSRLISDNPTQVQRVKELRANYQQWISYAPSIIQRKQLKGDFDPSILDVRRQMMDRMRDQITTMIQTEEKLREDRTDKAQRTTQLVLASSFGLTLWLGILLAFFTRCQLIAVSQSYTRALLAAQEQTEARRESEERFRLLVEGVKDYAIFMLDPNGRIVTWNMGAERLKGYRQEEIIGEHFSRFYPAEHIQQGYPEQELRIAIAEGRFEEEGWRVRKDGSWFWANVVVTALRDEAGNLRGFAKVTRDITERKQAEEELQKSFKDLSDIKFALDQAAILAATDAQGIITYVNDKFCEISKYSPEELIGRTHRIINSSYHSQQFFKELWETISSGNVWHGEIRNKAKDGTIYWVDTTIVPFLNEQGQPFQYLAIRFETTQRKQAEEALHRSVQRLEALHKIDHAILASHSLTELSKAALSRIHSLVPCQQAFVILFNFETDEANVMAASGKGDVQLSESSSLRVSDFVSGWAFGEQIPYGEEMTAINRCPAILEQQLSAAQCSCITVPLADGNLLGELILTAPEPTPFNSEHEQIAREVAAQLAIATKQAQLREQLQHYTAELEQRVAERTHDLQEANAELEAFGYSVSHDLRAPLRAMQGFSEALLEDYGERLDPIGQDYAHRIVTAAQRMDHLIQDLLNYSRLSRAEIRLQRVDLASVVQEALTQLETQLQEKHVQVTVEEQLYQVIGHRTTLVQVITNLLSNAIKFVPSGVQPQVRVWAEHLEAEERGRGGERERGREGEGETNFHSSLPTPNSQLPTPHSPLPTPQPWIRLWIEDNGLGIAPEYHQRIFRVFERLHGIESYPGTGIGLAIVRKGIERIGGRVGLESQLGQGSRFWIDLPRVREE